MDSSGEVALPSPAPQPPELHCVERRGFRAAAGLLTLLCMLVRPGCRWCLRRKCPAVGSETYGSLWFHELFLLISRGRPEDLAPE